MFGRVVVPADLHEWMVVMSVVLAHAADVVAPNLAGLLMRRFADLPPGIEKSDLCDEFIAANTARTVLHALRVDNRHSETQSAPISRLRGLVADFH